MDKQTPTQIASEIMKGCGTFVLFWNVNCGDFEDLKHSDHYIYCDKCSSKILAYRTAWENELEFLNKLFNSIICSRTDGIVLEQRISELTSALKILNGEHK